jgi:hypothetical protein
MPSRAEHTNFLVLHGKLYHSGRLFHVDRIRNLPSGGYFFFFEDFVAVVFGAAFFDAAFFVAFFAVTFAAFTSVTSGFFAVFFPATVFLPASVDFSAEAFFFVLPPSLAAGAEKMRSQFVQNLGFVPVRTIGPLMKVTSILC